MIEISKRSISAITFTALESLRQQRWCIGLGWRLVFLHKASVTAHPFEFKAQLSTREA
jgi:hypothetical protein